jgi:hypothetical protein
MYTPDQYRDYTFQTFSLGGFLIFCGIMFVPVSIVYVLFKPIETLERKEFKDIWGVVYESYNYQDKLNILYRLFFCTRRIIFVGSIVIFDEIPSMQLYLLLEVNLGMSLFIGRKPMKNILNNRIEIMNEFMMASICYNAIVLTDYLIENEYKYEGSWIMISLISFAIMINISIVLWFLTINLKSIGLRCQKIIHHHKY